LNTVTQKTSEGLTSSQKKIFTQTFYTFFINGSLALILGAMLPYMRETYTLGYQLAGLLISIHSVGNLISSFVGGILPNYLGRKRSILLLSSTGFIAFILMTLTSNPIILLIAFFLTGINRGAVSNFNNSIINEIATGKAWALNLLHSVFAIGAFIAPFIALISVRTNPNGWIYACYILAFLCLTELITYAFMKIPERTIIVKEKKKTDWSFLKNKYFLTAAGILFSYLCAEQAINGWLVSYFKDSGLMSGSIAQSMSSLLWIVILVGRLVSATLSKKIKQSKLLAINAIGYLIFFIILLTATSMTPIIIGIIGVGFSMAGLYPTTLSCVGGIIKEYPMALSFLLTFAGLGAILMPTLIGFVADNIGIVAGMSTVIIAVFFTVFFIMFNFYIYRGHEEN
jgi:FHS family glucose/mannose:H+ symporter-like MFS transporter